jgi:hypothetical protein
VRKSGVAYTEYMFRMMVSPKSESYSTLPAEAEIDEVQTVTLLPLSSSKGPFMSDKSSGWIGYGTPLVYVIRKFYGVGSEGPTQ